MVGPELGQRAIEEGVVVLQTVSLIHYKYCPVDGSEEVLVLQQDLIRGEDGVKLEPLVGMTPLVLPNLERQRESINTLPSLPSPPLPLPPSLTHSPSACW